MNIDAKRRVILKGAVAASTLGMVLGAGLLTPRRVLASWPEAAFKQKELAGTLKALFGSEALAEGGDIKIKAPDIAENGAVVPITVSSGIEGIESISILAPNNPIPLIANFELGDGAVGFVSTRIKMGKSGDVVAVVKAGGKLYSTKKSVKVTIGGCGG